MSAFDHPRSELDDLLSRECLLHHKATDDGIADLECYGSLLHGDPAALFRWGTGWKALGVANVLQALLRPSVAVACAIAQPVQNRYDGAIFTDQSELANQLRYFFGVDVVVITGFVLTYCQFGVRTSRPMQLEMDRRRIVRRIGHNLLEHGTQDALLQCHR